MTYAMFLVGLFQCAMLFILGRTGGKLRQKAARDRQEAERKPSEGWPKVALIIPMAGERQNMDRALKSLLDQDYPDFIPVLVTATEDDAACKLIRMLRAEHPQVQHIIAGRAEKCGQKNRNLLAAVEACGAFPDVYVFCDSTHLAEKDFLRCLAGPIARGEAAICTGYHVVLPGDNSIITLAYAQSVLLMRFLQGMAAFTQPWGGALAISRTAFARYDVATLWSSNVVDDCSLAALLQKDGVHIRLCPAALLKTSAHAHPLPVWRAWLERQVLFLKFCMPAQWCILGLFATAVVLPPVWCVWACAADIFGAGSEIASFLALCWLCLVCWVMARWRSFLPSKPPLGRWLQAFFCASLMFAMVWVGTIASRSILWQNCLYRVGKGGKVLSIQRL
ncbi:MAG: glycosyltransferase [Desulfovibrio sp.]